MPHWKLEITRRLESLNLSTARQASIIEELSQFLEDHYNELLSSGKSEQEAYKAAVSVLDDNELLVRELNKIERQPKPEPVVMGLGEKI
jgi:hypothetical protein